MHTDGAVRAVLGTCFLLFAAHLAGAGTVAADWTAPMPSIYYSGAMVALDSSDNAFITGSLYSPAVVVTAKRDKLGNLLWEKQFDAPGTSFDVGTWVSVDTVGNAIVAGSSYCCSGRDQDGTGFIVLKYDPQGALLWSSVTPYTRGRVVRVMTDVSGNAYVIGRAWGGTDYIVTIKYSPDGVKLWTQTAALNSMSVDTPASLALAPNGDVVVVGGASGWFEIYDYDNNGNLKWSRSLSASTGATDVAVSAAGEIYVVGGTYSVASGSQMLALKYDAQGNQIWSKNYDGYSVSRVAAAGGGDVVITGIAVSTTGMPYTNWRTHRIDSAGNVLWSQTYDQHKNNDESPRFVSLGPDGSAYITGVGGPAPPGPNLSYQEMVTVKYLADGTQDWVATSDQYLPGLGVQRASDGSLFVLATTSMTVVHYVEGSSNQSPVAKIGGSPSISYAPITVNFSSAGSYDPDGTIAAYSWVFGDGTTSTKANPVHTYMLPGTFGVTLTVTDNGGLTNTAVMNIFALSCSLNCMRSTAIQLAGQISSVSGRVTVQDAYKHAISGATVSITWTKPDGSLVSQSANTNMNGLASFTVGNTGKGVTTLNLNNITKAGYQFDPANSKLSASITK